MLCIMAEEGVKVCFKDMNVPEVWSRTMNIACLKNSMALRKHEHLTTKCSRLEFWICYGQPLLEKSILSLLRELSQGFIIIGKHTSSSIYGC